jgi:dienelactone hydrolase
MNAPQKAVAPRDESRHPRPLRRHALALAVFLGSTFALTAQGFPAGFRDTSFANTTGQGSATLTARVHYPATQAGANAPLRPQTGGYPVVVFLHGFAALGRFYGPLGEALAEAGYVGVFADTAQFSGPTLTADGVALFAALDVANRQTGNFLQNALDLTRAAVAGHSMGGGSTVSVLAAEPRYRAGVCFAPVDAVAAGPLVRAPVLIVHGLGDTIVPLATGPQPLFDRLTQADPLRVLYLLDNAANHTNVCGFLLSTQSDRDVFARCVRVTLGFLGHVLDGNPIGLDEVVGDAARTEPRLVRIDAGVRTPQSFADAPARIGTTVRKTVFARPGPALLAIAAAPAAVPTPFGTLALDPASLVVLASGVAGTDQRFVTTIPIPNNLWFPGLRLACQGLGLGAGIAGDELRLTQPSPFDFVQ